MPDFNIGDCGCCGGTTTPCGNCPGGVIAAAWQFDIPAGLTDTADCHPGTHCSQFEGHYVLTPLTTGVCSGLPCCFYAAPTKFNQCSTVRDNSFAMNYDAATDSWLLYHANGLSLTWSCPGASFNCLGTNTFTGDGIGTDGFGIEICSGWPTSVEVSPA